MEKIDVHKQIHRVDFQNLTIEMLSKKEKINELETYKDAPETLTNFFAKNEYTVTTNQNSLEAKTLLNADKKYAAHHIIIGIIALALYCAFYLLFPIISKIAIEDGWLFILPMALMVVKDILHIFSVDKFDKALNISIIITGIVLPVLSVFAAIFASETTGMGDTACVIAYFVIAIPCLILSRTIATEEKILKEIKSSADYKNELDIAIKKDAEEAALLRAEDEKEFQEYVRDYTQRRNELLPNAPQLKAEWECYKDLYNEWEPFARSVQTNFESLTSIMADIKNLYGKIFSICEKANANIQGIRDGYLETQRNFDFISSKYRDTALVIGKISMNLDNIPNVVKKPVDFMEVAFEMEKESIESLKKSFEETKEAYSELYSELTAIKN